MKLMRGLAVGIAAAALTLTAACSSGAPSIVESDGPSVDTEVSFPEGSTMARLQDGGKLRIGTKFDQPLFGLLNPVTNTPEGFDIEIGKIVAASLGIPASDIEWVETVSANREPFLQQNRVDLAIATYSITEERKKVVDFVGPYLTGGQQLMVLADNPDGIKELDDLAGKSVCSVEGSTSSTNIREMVPGANVVAFDSYSKCADALKNGQVVAASTDYLILAGLMSLDPGAFELVGPSFTEEPMGIGIPKGQDDLVEFICEVIAESYENGQWDAAWEKTFGQAIDEEPGKPELVECN